MGRMFLEDMQYSVFFKIIDKCCKAKAWYTSKG